MMIFALVGIYDLIYRKIPNIFIVMIMIEAVIHNSVDMLNGIAGLIIPAVPMFCISLKVKALRGGDIKYIAACGMYFGLLTLSYILMLVTYLSLIHSFRTKTKSVPLAWVMLIAILIFRGV